MALYGYGFVLPGERFSVKTFFTYRELLSGCTIYPRQEVLFPSTVYSLY